MEFLILHGKKNESVHLSELMGNEIKYMGGGGDEITSKKNKNKNLTKKEELLVHLLNFEHHREDYVVPESVTEQGIQKALGCSWGLVSTILKECINQGYIYRVKSKVVGKKYKQFTFFLTKDGRKYALKIHKETEK